MKKDNKNEKVGAAREQHKGAMVGEKATPEQIALWKSLGLLKSSKNQKASASQRQSKPRSKMPTGREAGGKIAPASPCESLTSMKSTPRTPMNSNTGTNPMTTQWHRSNGEVLLSRWWRTRSAQAAFRRAEREKQKRLKQLKKLKGTQRK
jgi:hypothetical protein